jgi:spore maturation protein CgeB
VLKVSSPFEQWFYSEIAAWRHYVPVSQDLSDLTEKLDWSLQHEEETRSIAERGQKFAINHTYETGLEIAVTAAHESIV